MGVITIGQEWQPSPDERLCVLTVPCPWHHDVPLIKVSTWDGVSCRIYTDGTYPHDDPLFAQVVAPDDAEARRDLAEAGLRTEPPITPADGSRRTRFRYRLKCSRPSCPIDLQLTAESIRSKLYPRAIAAWQAGESSVTLALGG